MTTPFKFPPPPPPPPKASSNDAQTPYNSQRSGHGGKADRGYPRGTFGRGRGRNAHGGSRGSYGQGGRGGYGPSWGSSTGSHQLGRGEFQQQSAQYVSHQLQSQHYQPATAASSVPTSTNGAYGQTPENGPLPFEIPTPHVDPAAFAQAMALGSTPAGMQAMAAAQNQLAATKSSYHTPQYLMNLPPKQSPSQDDDNSAESGLSRKRKRNERASIYHSLQNLAPAQNAQLHGQKPPRAKAAAPPPVPSFGFTLPAAPKSQPFSGAKTGKQEKRKINLGLTRQIDGVESEEEEDVDEEAAYASNEKLTNGFVFEHEGESISLQTPAEIAAWIRDRKRQFPTKMRIAQKAEEAARRRAQELDFLRKIKGKPEKKRVDQGTVSAKRATAKAGTVPTDKRSSGLDNMHKYNGQSKVQKLIPSAPEDDISIPPDNKPPAIDLGLGYDSETDRDEDSSELEESSVLSSSKGSSDDSDSDDDLGTGDSDAAPEQQSSALAPAPIVVPPRNPVSAVKEPSSGERAVCHRWKQFGKCAIGRHCRYWHPSKKELRDMKDTPKRVGLYEKLVEQELEKADRLALDAIKYLGRHGFLG